MNLSKEAKNDPPGSFRIFYEWDNFTPVKPNVHKPGADLQGPGDSYRFTAIRDDKWSNDPSLEVVLIFSLSLMR